MYSNIYTTPVYAQRYTDRYLAFYRPSFSVGADCVTASIAFVVFRSNDSVLSDLIISLDLIA